MSAKEVAIAIALLLLFVIAIAVVALVASKGPKPCTPTPCTVVVASLPVSPQATVDGLFAENEDFEYGPAALSTIAGAATVTGSRPLLVVSSRDRDQPLTMITPPVLDGLFGAVLMYMIDIMPWLYYHSLYPDWRITSKLYGPPPDHIFQGIVEPALPPRPPPSWFRRSQLDLLYLTEKHKYCYTYDQFQLAHDLFFHFCKVCAPLLAAADRFCQTKFPSPLERSKVLGLHYRGTDKHTSAEGVQFTVDDFLSIVDDFLGQHPEVRCVFVATDEQPVLLAVEQHLMKKYVDDSATALSSPLRCNGEQGQLLQPQQPRRRRVSLLLNKSERVRFSNAQSSKSSSVQPTPTAASQAAQSPRTRFTVVYQDALRSDGTKSLHKNPPATGHLDQAAAAMIEVLLLSRCDYVLKTASAMSAWAKIFNPELTIFVGSPGTELEFAL